MFSLFALYELIVIDYVILVYGVLPTGPFHTTPSPPSLPPGGCLDMEPNVNQLLKVEMHQKLVPTTNLWENHEGKRKKEKKKKLNPPCCVTMYLECYEAWWGTSVSNDDCTHKYNRAALVDHKAFPTTNHFSTLKNK